MSRYFRGRVLANGWVEAEGDFDEPARNEIQADDHEAVNTGLVWASGEPIMRTPNPIWFGRDKEWD